MTIFMIIGAALITALFAYVLYMRFMLLKTMELLKMTVDKHNEMLISLTDSVVKRLETVNERIGSLEDFEALMKQQMGGEQYTDYWQSVMNYNPLFHQDNGIGDKK